MQSPVFNYNDMDPSFIPWINSAFQNSIEEIIKNNKSICTKELTVPQFNNKLWLSFTQDNIKELNLDLKIGFTYETHSYKIITLNNLDDKAICMLYELGDGIYSSDTKYEEGINGDTIKSDVFFNKLLMFSTPEISNRLNHFFTLKLNEFSVKPDQYRAELIITDGGQTQISTTKLLSGPDILPEAYPYIKNLDEQIESFIQSKQSIMLLQGPPGTGKTTLIKYIAAKMLGGQVEKRALMCNVTTDGETITASQFKRIAAELIKPNNSLIVFEDSDSMVKSRKEGNSAITPIFTLVDGLFSVNNKWIFTTNLEDDSKIDRALLRPGRCHSYIKSRPLTIEESKILSERQGLNITDKIKKSMTLAEIYHLSESSKYGYNKDGGATGTKVGFI